MFDDLLDELNEDAKLGLNATWLRSGVTRGLAHADSSEIDGPRVDRERNMIRGFSVITKGLAEGHGFLIDDVFLDQIVAFSQKKIEAGFKMRFDHPNASTTSMGSTIGRAKNFRKSGDRVLADAHFIDAAKEEHVEHIMQLAEKDPDLFGASIVFEGQFEDQLDEDGKPLRDAEGRLAPRLARLKRLFAVDVVDEPAANPSGFLSKVDSLASKCTEFLNRWAAHDLLPNIDARITQSLRTIKESTAMELTETELQVKLAAAKQEGITAGIKQEQDRAAAILNFQKENFKDMTDVALSAIEMGISLEVAQQTMKEKQFKAINASAPPTAGGGSEEPSAPSAPAHDPSTLSVEERGEKTWAEDAGIRAEFKTKGAYMAYLQNEEAGNIKIYK